MIIDVIKELQQKNVDEAKKMIQEKIASAPVSKDAKPADDKKAQDAGWLYGKIIIKGGLGFYNPWLLYGGLYNPYLWGGYGLYGGLGLFGGGYDALGLYGGF